MRIKAQIGPYELVEQIAKSDIAASYGVTVETRTGTPRLAALKILHPAVSGNAEFQAHLVEQTRLAEQLSHPSLAQTFDCGQRDGVSYLLLEYIAGAPLSVLLNNQSIDPSVAAYIASELAVGVAHAHGRRDKSGQPLQVIHGDIRPRNVLISTQGAVKLMDFGLARARKICAEDPIPNALREVDLYAHAMPSHARGEAPTIENDVFSLSAILYMMLTGRSLFGGVDYESTLRNARDGVITDISTLRPELDATLASIVMRGLGQSPEGERDIATAQQLRTSLAAWLREHDPSFGRQRVKEVFGERLEQPESLRKLRALSRREFTPEDPGSLLFPIDGGVPADEVSANLKELFENADPMRNTTAAARLTGPLSTVGAISPPAAPKTSSIAPLTSDDVVELDELDFDDVEVLDTELPPAAPEAPPAAPEEPAPVSSRAPEAPAAPNASTASLPPEASKPPAGKSRLAAALAAAKAERSASSGSGRGSLPPAAPPSAPAAPASAPTSAPASKEPVAPKKAGSISVAAATPSSDGEDLFALMSTPRRETQLMAPVEAPSETPSEAPVDAPAPQPTRTPTMAFAPEPTDMEAEVTAPNQNLRAFDTGQSPRVEVSSGAYRQLADSDLEGSASSVSRRPDARGIEPTPSQLRKQQQSEDEFDPNAIYDESSDFYDDNTARYDSYGDDEVGTAPKSKRSPLVPLLILIVLGLVGYIAYSQIGGSSSPKEAVATTAGLNVTSTPEQARIFMNDEDTGHTTPHTFTNLDTGESVRIRAVLSGFQDSPTVTAQVVSGSVQEVALELQAQQHSVRVSSTPEGATIYVDGEERGVTPALIGPIEANPALGINISLQLDGYKPRALQHTWQGNQSSSEVDLELEQLPNTGRRR